MAFSFNPPSSSGASTGGIFGSAGANNPGNTGNNGGNVFGNAGGSTTFSFGQPSASASAENKSGGLFGGSSSGNLFGKPSDNKSTDNKPLFGGLGGANSQAPGTPSSQATTQPSLFGSTTPAATSGPSMFGNPSTTPAGQPPSTSLFGASTGGTSGQSQAAPKPTFSFGNNAASSSSNLSMPAPSTGGGLFGQQSSQKPSSGGGGSGGIFGQNTSSAQPASAGGLFGSQKQPSDIPASTASNNLFGAKPATNQSSGSSTLFGATSKPADNAATTSSLFGAKPAENSQQGSSTGGTFSLFGQKKDDKPADSSLASKPDAAKSAFFQQTNNTASSTPAPAETSTAQPATSSIFTSTGTSGSAAGTASGFFAKPAAPASQSQPQSTEQPKTGGFSFPSLAPSSSQTPSSTTQSSTTAPATTPLFQLGGASGQTPASSAAPTATTATATPAPTSHLFQLGGASKTSAPSATAAATTTTSPPTLGLGQPAEAPSATQSTAAFTTSTTGPVAPTQSRLRNKTMDEILTRWASDLTRYTKEFKQHAETIAHWDQIIVDNSSSIDKLYLKTRTCEKQTMSVEIQLSAVENQQNELEAWLNKYENDVDEMLAKDGPASSELGGPDQERERTYKLAEKLGERLDDMGRDLQSMVEEVNAANSGLGKAGKADEPVTQIVKILNAHLSQLQAIDQGTTALQAKVTSAQKAANGMNYMSGSLNGDNRGAVDDFYRSYMGRR